MTCSFCKSEGRPVVSNLATAAICRECAEECVLLLQISRCRREAAEGFTDWLEDNREVAVERLKAA